MSQPITHYHVVQQALNSVDKELIDNYSNFVRFGTFGPDLFYLTKQSNYADMIHQNYSFNAFCSMLESVKANWQNDNNTAGKQLGFALGFYGHVITDCIFHPYVYRRSNDYWHFPKPPEFDSCERNHKKIEAAIDHHILEEIIHPETRNTEVNCGERYLDTALSEMLYSIFNSIYKIPSNLIDEAYSRYCIAIPILYNSQNILYRIDDILDRLAAATLTPLRHDDLNDIDLNNSPWLSEGNSRVFNYNAKELFDMSVKAVSEIVPVVYGYLNDPDITDVYVYLKSSNVLFLDDNWNLDTGLPATWNSDETIFLTDQSRFDVGVNLLEGNYTRLR